MAIAHKEAVEKVIKEPEVEEPKVITYPASVKNIHTQTISLESGQIKPGEEGTATQAEVSCLLGQYLELV
jgi:hypothetical protein